MAREKMSREERKALERQQEHEEKILSKKREVVYKEMIQAQKVSLREDKIAPTDSFISLQHINKIYPNRVQAVFDFNLEIKEKEFIVFVGPSGCGKSTTLRMIAGLEEITGGDLYIDGEFANELEPKDRDTAMVFQSYALYPHMTVYDNMAFGLQMRHVPKDEIEERVKKAAEILQITEYLDRKPKALSGGQCQRVALGRAIVRNSNLYLMDEPLSNLDAKLRVQMRSEIVRLHNELKTTTIYVTHDQTEAMTMANRIVVMKDGYIQQIGTPREIYNNPANIFVATFIGSPAMNIFEAQYDNGTLSIGDSYSIKLKEEYVKKHDAYYEAEVKRLTEEIEHLEKEIKGCEEFLEKKAHKEKVDKNSPYADSNYMSFMKMELEKVKPLLEKYQEIVKSKSHLLKMGIRPEDVIRPEDATKKVNLSNKFKTKVELSELLGREYYVHFVLDKFRLISKVSDNDLISIGDEIELGFNLNNLHIFDIDTTNLIF